MQNTWDVYFLHANNEKFGSTKKNDIQFSSIKISCKSYTIHMRHAYDIKRLSHLNKKLENNFAKKGTNYL